MVETRGTAVEVKLPSRLGFEKVAMGTAASVAKLMGFPDARIEDLKTALAEAEVRIARGSPGSDLSHVLRPKRIPSRFGP